MRETSISNDNVVSRAQSNPSAFLLTASSRLLLIARASRHKRALWELSQHKCFWWPRHWRPNRDKQDHKNACNVAKIYEDLMTHILVAQERRITWRDPLVTYNRVLLRVTRREKLTRSLGNVGPEIAVSNSRIAASVRDNFAQFQSSLTHLMRSGVSSDNRAARGVAEMKMERKNNAGETGFTRIPSRGKQIKTYKILEFLDHFGLK